MGTVTQFKPLRDRDEADWGKTRVDYALAQKRLLRDLWRMRRSRYLMSLNTKPHVNGRFVPVYQRVLDSDVFETTSGLRAYVKTVISPITPVGSMTSIGKCPVTLPYVSILSSPA